MRRFRLWLQVHYCPTGRLLHDAADAPPSSGEIALRIALSATDLRLSRDGSTGWLWSLKLRNGFLGPTQHRLPDETHANANCKDESSGYPCTVA